MRREKGGMPMADTHHSPITRYDELTQAPWPELVLRTRMILGQLAVEDQRAALVSVAETSPIERALLRHFDDYFSSPQFSTSRSR